MIPPLLSPYIRDRRYKIIQPFLSQNMLDVGCGNAYLLRTIPPVERYIGLDINEPMLNMGREYFPHHEFHICNLEGGNIPAHVYEQPVQTILLIALLEHLANPAQLITALEPALAPGGYLVATTPTPLGHTVHAMGARLGLFYKEAAEDHKSRLNQNHLRHMCQDAGLEVVMYRQFEFGCNQLIVARK
ncbi:class I SAM-dependent methyltransferase [Candidatus Oscillochloris fontis]|uniref:class I SAM-dependent methyltransferase n=1 Tax=Candidatus Oscillochloris fontis TaxID=2496868 RepID=UPI00101B6452|nr:class I SAM-dependent methyltransferase [Candidatus Oscillochloris fontis]